MRFVLTLVMLSLLMGTTAYAGYVPNDDDFFHPYFSPVDYVAMEAAAKCLEKHDLSPLEVEGDDGEVVLVAPGMARKTNGTKWSPGDLDRMVAANVCLWPR